MNFITQHEKDKTELNNYISKNPTKTVEQLINEKGTLIETLTGQKLECKLNPKCNLNPKKCKEPKIVSINT